MKRNEAAQLMKALTRAIDSLVDEGVPPETPDHQKGVSLLTPPPPQSPANGKLPVPAEWLEQVYVQFRNRMIDELRVDPIFVQLLAQRPEIEVTIEPRRVQLDGGTLKGRVARLIAAGWFASSRATGAVRRELARTGADPGGGGTLSDTLGGMVRDGILTREGEGYAIAPGLRITEQIMEAR